MDCQMPILDGYRSTYLIRNGEPYASIPGMKSVPIVAMTASAIRGDREKCRDAGMDDYLAKPVKAKSLEQMLVKWALNIKRDRRSPAGTTESNQDHTDQDSITTDMHPSPPLDSAPVSPSSMGPSAPASFIKIAEPIPPPQVRPKYRSAATSTPFNTPSAFSFDPKDISRNVSYPGQPLRSQSAGMDVKVHFVKGTSGILNDEESQSLQRVESEEKAAALRNDKLIQTADETHPDRRERGKLSRDHRANGGGARTLVELNQAGLSNESVLQLTEENVGRWEREHGGSSLNLPATDVQTPGVDSSPERNQASGGSSSGPEIGGSMVADRSTGVPTPTRAEMVRMESQLTVTPSRRSKGKHTEIGNEGEQRRISQG